MTVRGFVLFEQKSIDEVYGLLHTDGQEGLSEKEAIRRLQKEGPNVLQEPPGDSWVVLFLKQLQDPLIYVLLVAAAVSILLKESSDAIIIGVVVLLNAFVGMIQEGRAIKALDALKKLSSPRAMVIRDGKHMEIPSAELVVGDLVCLEAGSQVPADLRLTETVQLKIEESALTGESLPMEKDVNFRVWGNNSSLGDRKNMAYMSTMVSCGRGRGVVVATGMHTEIGQIASMISQSAEEMTPLQKRLGDLGKVLSLLSLILCGALFLVAVLQHRNIPNMLITAISLAVAAVPEGLPAVVTICLALSVTRMVKVNTIVRRLPSVETLGAVSVVCSDKTGTLTQNKMVVEKCFLCDEILPAGMCRGELCEDFFRGMVLCNDAVLNGEEKLGDPTELALMEFAYAKGYRRQELDGSLPRIGEIPFDSDRKRMTTLHSFGMAEGLSGDGYRVYMKGAPDEVIQRCTKIFSGTTVVPLTESGKREVQQALERMSGLGLRSLAVAVKNFSGRQIPAQEQWERGLVFLGIVGICDPVRPEAAPAVKEFAKAGVRTVMITGDHVDTAFAIGKQLGIAGEYSQCMTGERLESLSEDDFAEELEHIRIFARVSPRQKVKIVRGLQKKGHVVAMTGDGVNDAPSLKMADVGIAMGKMGTDVARQAADMVLTDDNFATIRKAMEEGRGVYENIRKSVIFLLSSNMGELITMFVAVICGFAAPLKSSHILWINLITDSLPALALGMDKNDGRSLMEHSPRSPKESLFARGGLSLTLLYGALIGAISLAAFLLLPVDLTKAQTYAFTVLGMSQLFHAIGMRDMGKSVFRMKHWENPLMLLAVAIGFALQFAVTEVPVLIEAFGTSPLSGREWAVLAGLSAMPLLLHEVIVLVGKKGFAPTMRMW